MHLPNSPEPEPEPRSRKQPVREAIFQMLAGTYEFQPLAELPTDMARREKYALTAIFLRELWRNVLVISAAHSFTRQPRVKNPLDDIKRYAMEMIDLAGLWWYLHREREKPSSNPLPLNLRLFLVNSEHPDLPYERRVELAQQIAQPMTSQAKGEFLGPLIEDLDPHEKIISTIIADTPHGDRLYERYCDFVSHHYQEQLGEVRCPTDHVQDGFANSINMIIGVFDAIPRLFENLHGRQITQEELRQALDRSFSFLVKLSDMPMELFLKIRDEILRVSEPAQSNFYLLALTLDDRLGLEWNVVSKDFVEYLMNQSPTEEHAGCPAGILKGQGQKTVIAEEWDWFRQLAEQAYIPTFPIQSSSPQG